MEILEEKVHLWIDSARFVKSKPGIYVLYDKKLDAIYAVDYPILQAIFTKYLDGNFEGEPCKQKTHAYQRTFTANPKEKKKLILDSFYEKYGKMPECNTD